MSEHTNPLPTTQIDAGMGSVLGRSIRGVPGLLPGLLLCLAVTVAAIVLEHAEAVVFGTT